LLLAFCHAVAVAIMVLALAGVGAVHSVSQSESPQVEAFLLTGGSLADLCADTDGDGMPDHGECPECQVGAATAVPAIAMPLQEVDLAFVAKVVAPKESRAIRKVLNPANGLRAPPVA
jgi:hypothetical protein